MIDTSDIATTVETRRATVADHIRLVRPSHWLKNAFVFAPLIYGKALLDPSRLVLAIEAFGAFCLISSSVYIVNDILDREADAEHPVKRNRPIASGRISVRSALLQLAFVLAGTVALMVPLPWAARILIIAYAMINLAYSLGLKHVVLIDIFIIAAGCMLRVLTRAGAIEVAVSHWLVICTRLPPPRLGVAKRRSEIAHPGRGD